jgi:hypothetical protein
VCSKASGMGDAQENRKRNPQHIYIPTSSCPSITLYMEAGLHRAQWDREVQGVGRNRGAPRVLRGNASGGAASSRVGRRRNVGVRRGRGRLGDHALQVGLVAAARRLGRVLRLGQRRRKRDGAAVGLRLHLRLLPDRGLLLYCSRCLYAEKRFNSNYILLKYAYSDIQGQQSRTRREAQSLHYFYVKTGSR